MVKRFGTKGVRTPSKKEKILRALEQQESERIGKQYVYPFAIVAVVLFFIALYAFLFTKASRQ